MPIRSRLIVIGTLILCGIGTVSFAAEPLANDEAKPRSLKPRSVVGRFDVPPTTIVRWVNDLVVFRKTRTHQVAIDGSYTVVVSHDGVATPLVYMTRQVIAADPSASIKRVLCSFQDLTTNPGLRTGQGVAVDLAVEFDLFVDGDRKTFARPMTIDGIETLDSQTTEAVIQAELEHSRVNDPLLIGMVPVGQTLFGRTSDVATHSVLQKTIEGVAKRGDLTDVYVKVGATHMIITFRSKRPIHYRGWRRLDDQGVALVTDEIFVRWSEIENSGVQLPVRIQGVRRAKPHIGEFDLQLEWKIDGQVDPSLFDPATLKRKFVGDYLR